MPFIWSQIESENKVLPLYSLDAEFARPLWVFGMNSYEFVQDHEQRNLIACSYRWFWDYTSITFLFRPFFLYAWVEEFVHFSALKVLDCVCRQQGRSYLGILDDMQSQSSKLSVLDIHFTDIDNIVILKKFSLHFSFSCCPKGSWLSGNPNPNSNLNHAMWIQTSGNNCLYVEGASAVHPSSVAKVQASCLHLKF